MTYVDGCIIVGDSTAHIETLIQSLHDGTENFILQDKGSIDKYLGGIITLLDNLTFSLTQPFLIDLITAFLGIDICCTNKRLKPVGKPLLNKNLNGFSWKYSWDYRGTIGMLTYLMGSVWSDIAMAVHQYACFSTNPMQWHEQAVIRIGQYLLFKRQGYAIFS